MQNYSPNTTLSVCKPATSGWWWLYTAKTGNWFAQT